MTGIARNVMIMLFSFITTGVKGEDLIFAEQGYDIKFPCEEDLVCFHIWLLDTNTRNTRDYIAIVSNGDIRTAKSEDEDSECTLQIKDLTEEDVGRHHCRQEPGVFSPNSTPSAAPVLNLIPGKPGSLQCVLLAYVEHGRCGRRKRKVNLTWVDEAGAEIQEDSQHQIKRESSCDITLTVTFQSPENKKFRCQATVGEQVQTSVELEVRVPAPKGRGRGFIIELEPENQGRNQDAVGVAVGVVGCVALTVLVVAFLVNRRRTRNQLPDESRNTISTNNVTNADDVIYADITLPAGSDQVWVHEDESTEYVSVRYR